MIVKFTSFDGALVYVQTIHITHWCAAEDEPYPGTFIYLSSDAKIYVKESVETVLAIVNGPGETPVGIY